MKIMKKIICVMIILIQVAFVIASASDIKELIATKTETPVYIDNHLLKSDNPIVNINGVTYVPIRDAFESLGSEVNWTKGGYVFVYTQNQYDEGETSSNIKYHYYKKQINFDENVLKEKYGYEYVKVFENKITDTDNIEDVLNKLGEISNQEEHKSSSFINVLEGGWYDVYENKERNIWIINIQYDQSNTIIDGEKFYTVNKENGEVKKYKSIGTLNSFNKYIEEN